MEFTGISYRNGDFDILYEELSRKQWDLNDTETNPNVLSQIFHDNVHHTLDVLHPPKTFSVKKYKEPWISNEHLKFIRDKDISLKTAKRTNSEVDWKLARRLRNECLTKIRKAKCKFVQNELYGQQCQ